MPALLEHRYSECQPPRVSYSTYADIGNFERAGLLGDRVADYPGCNTPEEISHTFALTPDCSEYWFTPFLLVELELRRKCPIVPSVAIPLKLHLRARKNHFVLAVARGVENTLGPLFTEGLGSSHFFRWWEFF